MPIHIHQKLACIRWKPTYTRRKPAAPVKTLSTSARSSLQSSKHHLHPPEARRTRQNILYIRQKPAAPVKISSPSARSPLRPLKHHLHPPEAHLHPSKRTRTRQNSIYIRQKAAYTRQNHLIINTKHSAPSTSTIHHLP